MNNIYISNEEQKLDNTVDYNLWIDVIKQAVEDIVLIDILIEENKVVDKRLEELLEYKNTAEAFLFDPEHTINFDDYIIEYICQSCGQTEQIKMSKFSNSLNCFNCKVILSPDVTSYTIVKTFKEVTLEELLILFNFNDPDKFREDLKLRINILKQKKREKRERQKQYRRPRGSI